MVAIPFGPWAQARAGEVGGLYEAQVPVVSQGEAERAAALRTAFAEVLVRVTGNRQAPDLPALADAMRQPLRFVQQFRYRPLPGGGIAGDGSGPPGAVPYTQQLWVGFDPQAVNRLLEGAGVPVWGRTRPATLLWLAVEDRGERYLLGGDTPGELPALIAREARRRGLPMLLPLMDLEDQARLRFADVWGNFRDSVLDASQRYQAGAVLVGRLYREEAGQGAERWSARWSLYLAGEGEAAHWATSGVARSVALADGIDGAADRLAARYARVLNPDAVRSVEVLVTGIGGLDDYARVMAYLQGLDAVGGLQVIGVKTDQVRFRLRLRGDVAGLAQTIGFGDVLVAQSGEQAGDQSGEQAGDQSGDKPAAGPSAGSWWPATQGLTYRLLP